MARREPTPTATTLEISLLPDDLTLEADERATATGQEAAVLAVDDAALVRLVEDLAGERRVRGHRLDAVDGLGEAQLLNLQMCEEVEREFEFLLAFGSLVASVAFGTTGSHARAFPPVALNGSATSRASKHKAFARR